MSSNAPRVGESLFTRRLLLGMSAAAGTTVILSTLIAQAKDDDDTRSDDSQHDASDDEGKVAPLGTVPPGSFEVRIVDDDASGFQPGTITIERGQTVTFVNRDDDPHTATGAGFDTGIMQPGEQGTITFDVAGTFPYSCQIHPVMTGVVEVTDPVGGAAASPVASPQAATPAALGAEHQIKIVDFAFEPQELAIAPGDTVTWTNVGAAPHTATATDQSFDTGVLNPGDSATQTFTESGEVSYFCAFHPSMTGTITVS
ncbi:MAG: plastocyanin/azurin family copper-binding protein [Thermomicrobiales bacterium]